MIRILLIPSYLRGKRKFLPLLLLMFFAAKGAFGQTVTATGTNGSCPSSASITATASGFAANANMSYRLKESASGTFVQPNDGSYQVSSVFNGLPAGSYIVEALDQTNNVSANAPPVTVSISYLPMDLSYTKTDITCLGASTGQIVVTVANGSPVYSYAITSGPVTRPAQNNATFSNLPIGSYIISVTDACGVTKPLNVELVNNLVNLNNVEVFIGPYLANVVLGDCSSKQFSIYDLATNGVQGAIYGRIRVSYEYPAGSGNIYGAGGVLNAPGVYYNGGGPASAAIPFPSSLGNTTSPVNVVLTDDCGNQRILNNNRLPEPRYLAIEPSFCNNGITLTMAINGNTCLNASVTFTDNADPTKIFPFTLSTTSVIIANSGLEPGHTYTVTGVDGTNSALFFIGNKVSSVNQVSTPAANTPAYINFYNIR
ncbi:MAG: hypothetical protein EOO88_27555, partial [Pedobacter sp.]